MNRSTLNDFFGLRRKPRQHPHRLAFEPLEERRLLTADLVASTFDTTNGYNAISYNPASQTISYIAANGDHGLSYASGLAVAANGSYYVSSLGSGKVLHFSSGGVFLDYLGGNDANPAPLAVPGALAFGPTGNLYVADLGGTVAPGFTIPGAIYQFNVNSTTQQFQAADTLQLPTDFSPGGFTFATDATHSLIVGNISTQQGPYYQAIAEFDSKGAPSILVPTNSGIYAGSILPLSNGNLLIADFDADYDITAHHQIVEYSPPTGTSTMGTLTQLIDLSNYPQYDDAYGDAAQPISMTTDTDGSLLVGISPAEGGGGLHGSIVKYNFTTGVVSTVVSDIGSPSGLAYKPLEISAADWTSQGLTISETIDGMLHVYDTATGDSAFAPVAAASVSGIQITGLTTPSYTLTINASVANPIPFAGDAFVGGVSCSYVVQSGTIGPNLTGTGSLSKTGPGTATLSGMNTYLGGTVVTEGTLIVKSVTGVPDESSLSVGTNVLTAFGIATQTIPPAVPTPEISAEAAGVARANDEPASATHAPAAVALSATPASLPGPSLVMAATGYNKVRGIDTARLAAAGYVSWWSRAVAPWNSQDASAHDRLAALDAVIAEYSVPYP